MSVALFESTRGGETDVVIGPELVGCGVVLGMRTGAWPDGRGGTLLGARGGALLDGRGIGVGMRDASGGGWLEPARTMTGAGPPGAIEAGAAGIVEGGAAGAVEAGAIGAVEAGAVGAGAGASSSPQPPSTSSSLSLIRETTVAEKTLCPSWNSEPRRTRIH